MDWKSVSEVLTFLLSGNGIAILVTCVVAFTLPVLLHIWLYKAAQAEGKNDFLLLGPSGSGKTAFSSLIERKSSKSAKASPQTHTSQVSSFVSATLPGSITIHSNEYRSDNDPTLADRQKNLTKYRVCDTPGHGKLRGSQGMAQLRAMAESKSKQNIAKGIIFMVDAATVMDEDELRDAAGYLHDILLVLQKRLTGARHSVFKKTQNIPVLIAANKQDLFTALPANSVKERLEAEIEKIRQSKRKGLLDADATVGEDEQEMLGNDEGQQVFTFNLLEEEIGLTVTVVGGSVRSSDETDVGAGVRPWEEWIGSCL